MRTPSLLLSLVLLPLLPCAAQAGVHYDRPINIITSNYDLVDTTYIDRGRLDGVKVGDKFQVKFRDGKLATVVVVTGVFERMASVKIIDSWLLKDGQLANYHQRPMVVALEPDARSSASGRPYHLGALDTKIGPQTAPKTMAALRAPSTSAGLPPAPGAAPDAGLPPAPGMSADQAGGLPPAPGINASQAGGLPAAPGAAPDAGLPPAPGMNSAPGSGLPPAPGAAPDAGLPPAPGVNSAPGSGLPPAPGVNASPDAGMPPAPGVNAAPDAGMPPAPAGSAVPDAGMPPAPAGSAVPDAGMPSAPGAPDAGLPAAPNAPPADPNTPPPPPE